MTRAEATRVVAYLNAYFPNDAIEPESVAVWVEDIERLQHAEQAVEAARIIGRTGGRFPLMRDFLETYRAAVRRMPKPPELEEVTSGERELPDEVKEWLDRGPRDIE